MVITRPCKLRLEQGRLVITGEAGEAKVPLEDIAAVQIDCSEVLLTAPVLSACAGAGISLTVCDVTHTPNGVLLPFHTHSRATGVMRRQLALTQPRKKRLWQRVVQQKILNQAANLPADGRAQRQMLRLARSVNSGDPENREATAAGLYFQHAFEEPLLRREPEPLNGPLNYCYAVVRSAIARALVLHGLLPAFGIHHDNERNAFNLADDLFEPYRPLV